MTRKTASRPRVAFTSVPVRPRADGWTVERQSDFIEALARTANVEAAAREVGMTRQSAYALRARPEAESFREAWGVALDYAVHQLGEAVLERAIAGTATPIFYKGEQIGERRRFDEKLAMFILRLRDPERFGRWREDRIPVHHPDAIALKLKAALARVANDALDAEHGAPVDRRPPLPALLLLTAEEKQAMDMLQAERAQEAAEEAERLRFLEEEERSWTTEVDKHGGT